MWPQGNRSPSRERIEWSFSNMEPFSLENFAGKRGIWSNGPKGSEASEAMDKAGTMLAEAGLGSFLTKYPGEVSEWGMARRAEIVRALTNDPKVLLLDEPYRAMDALTKQIMHESLLETYDRTGVTIFFITHDLEEAIFLGTKCTSSRQDHVSLRRLWK